MRRRRILPALSFGAAAAVVAGCLAIGSQSHQTSIQTASYPTSSPASICGNASVLDGPATAPTGAVVIPAGTHNQALLDSLGADNTTFYFEPGVHHFAGDYGEYSQIGAGENSTYIGAPGAIIDGAADSGTSGDVADRYAFSGSKPGVTIENLTIRNFVAPRDEGVVNHNSADGWTIEHNTLTLNHGAALMAGVTNHIEGNCLKDNGQYGLNAYKAGNSITGLVVTGNEFTGNNTADWETQVPGCGCTGGAKFWAVNGADITNNWVHDNHGTGLWADTNDNDFLVQGNLIEGNDGNGLFYEISYNAQIKDNTFRNNAWVSGQAKATAGDNFPVGAIYLSEADGDSRVSARTAKIEVSGNQFTNNWGGIVGWANSDRFCNSPANTTSDCTRIVGMTNTSQCADPAITSAPLYTDCRWWTSDLDIHNNEFNFDPAQVAGGCNVTYCGYQALIANYGTYPAWSPYQGTVIQDNMIGSAGNNHWHDNTYVGPWKFKIKDQGTNVTAYQWTQAPYGQDADSTFDGGSPTPPSSSSSSTPPPSSSAPPAPTTIASEDFETGPYTAWYGSKIEGKRTGAHTGNWSLLITALDAWGGVELNNWPGYAVQQNQAYDFSLWYKEAAPELDNVEWSIVWRDASNTDLRTDHIEMPRAATDWTQATGSLTAPAGATHVTWNYQWADEMANAAIQIDDVDVHTVS